jgi:ferredoxin
MIHVREDLCPKNHPCPSVHVCPQGAIVQDDMFSAPRILEELCTDCGICTSSCRVFKAAREREVVAS